MAQLHEDSAIASVRRRFGSSGPAKIALAAFVVALVFGSALLGISVAGGNEVEYVAREQEAAPSADSVSEGDSAEESGEEDAAPSVYVDVDGAVNKPGLIVLSEGARVNDAVRAAGGFAESADTSAVNLAAPISDGQKLHVPAVGEQPSGAGQGSVAASTAPGTSEGAAVDINAASAEELDELPGVGPATAQAIIEEREQNGPFESVEDIMRVSGIGEKKFEKLKDSIRV